MALFRRADLQEKGFTEEQIDYIMAESGKALTNYMPKSEVEAQIKAAEKDPTKSEQYLALAGKAAKLEAFQTDDFGKVKKPYRDIVWEKMDHAEGHKPYAEQMTSMREKMPDLFIPEEPEDPEPAPAPKPQFGGPVKGEMPKGKEAPSFADAWNYKRN